MTAASVEVAGALSRLANDRRRVVPQYANLQARQGNSQAQRLLSDIGFLEAVPFQYVQANAANFSLEDDGAREVTQVVIVGIGAVEDAARLRSMTPRNRAVRARVSTSGVRTYPGSSTLLIPAYVDDGTHTPTKNTTVMHALTGPRGPSPHVYIDRNGGVYVAAPADARVTSASSHVHAFVIAIETAVAIKREDFDARRTDALWELPMTRAQALSLAIAVAKLTQAYPSIPKTFTPDLDATTPGFTYDFERDAGFEPQLFSTAPDGSPFDFRDSTSEGFFQLVTAQGSFDLAREVWRPRTAPPATAARAAARTVIGQVDTTGEESQLLGAYASIAALDRSTEMQVTARRQMFIQRQRVSHADADDAAEAATEVVEAGEAAQNTGLSPSNYQPHAYDFLTGKWGDGSPY